MTKASNKSEFQSKCCKLPFLQENFRSDISNFLRYLTRDVFFFFCSSYRDHDKLIEVKYGNVILVDGNCQQFSRKMENVTNSVTGRNYWNQRKAACQYRSFASQCKALLDESTSFRNISLQRNVLKGKSLHNYQPLSLQLFRQNATVW